MRTGRAKPSAAAPSPVRDWRWGLREPLPGERRVAPPLKADEHSLIPKATKKKAERESAEWRRSSRTRTHLCIYVRIIFNSYIIYIILLAAPSGLRLYDAVKKVSRGNGAHSKNHTTDKRNGCIFSRSCNGCIFSRSWRPSGERAGRSACRRTREGGLSSSGTDRARR